MSLGILDQLSGDTRMKGIYLALGMLMAVFPGALPAVDTGAVVGGAVGGGAGAAVGSEVGGRNGAILGSAVGAAVGTAILADDAKDQERGDRVSVQTREQPAPPTYQHIPPGHAKHWHKHKHKHKYR